MDIADIGLSLQHIVQLHFQAFIIAYKVSKKQGHHPRLTAHAFKTPEPICITFIKPQQCFVLNTSVNQIYNT